MDYISQTEKIIEFIEGHLKEKIDCDEIIARSFYSMTQFYRIFAAMADVSLAEYIRKRKLSCAAIELRTTSKRLIDIACEYGFESQEVFTRAFQREFDITPGKMRRLHHRIDLYERLNLRRKLMLEVSKLHNYSAVPVVSGTMNFAGIRRNVSPGSNQISEMWSEFTEKILKYDHLNLSHVYGICEYAPDAEDDDIFGYVCAVEISDGNTIPDNLIRLKIEPCTYIKIIHDESVRTIKETYKLFYGVWLPSSNYQILPEYTIEVYDRINGGMEIWIPVKEAEKEEYNE